MLWAVEGKRENGVREQGEGSGNGKGALSKKFSGKWTCCKQFKGHDGGTLKLINKNYNRKGKTSL